MGLDLGISTVKAALFNYEGRLLEIESDEYLIMPEGEKVEADPELYWALLVAVIRRLLLKWGGEPERITAVSVASHTETVIPLDAVGHPVRPALVWMDSRSQPEADELAAVVGPARELRVLGGGAKSHLWSQIKADVCKVRVVTPAQPEAAVLGAAVLAAVGAGLYPDIPAAVQRMTSSQEAIKPELTHREIYDSAYELYVSLYEAVKGLYSGCGRIEQLAARR